ncbi:MAG TPA: tetratricopeptide repeat protein [Usitatibacter sp.]|nr:tetratricopeptide repeat protein [Usitatibacter sp.]
MIDANLSSFERDVIDASMEVPVLVDFWAPWCGPCKALGPLLERLEREYGGRFRLVKVNSDTNPELVSSFSLKSIPYAVAFVDGNAVAQFSGAQPEVYIRAFLDRLIPNPSDIEHRNAREALISGDVTLAEDALKKAIALDPANDGARLDMISLLLDRGDAAGASAHYALLSPRAEQHSACSAVKARMEAVEAAACLPPEQELEGRVSANSDDLQARLDLADLRIAQRDYGRALDQLLEIAGRDRTFMDDIGRRRMLEVFEIAAEQVELVDEFRKKLSTIVF